MLLNSIAIPGSFAEEIKNSTLNGLSSESRVWIYQSDRAFTSEETQVLKNNLQDFVGDWTAHSQTLYAAGDVLFNRFIVLSVDEMRQGATGCSIDTSINFIKAVEKRLAIKLFDRMLFTYFDAGVVHGIASKDLTAAYNQKIIHDDTLMFDNLVPDLAALKNQWLKPLSESWHKKFLKLIDPNK